MVDRIFQDIEKTAGYHPAIRYLIGLTFYDDFIDQNDSLEGQFIPISTIAQRGLGHDGAKSGAGTNPKLFAIGVIPPSVNVTGRPLDRSATVANIEGIGQVDGASFEGNDEAEKSGALENKRPRNAASHRGAQGIVTDALRNRLGRDPSLGELQYAQAIGWLETSYGQGWKGDLKQSNNWGAVQCAGSFGKTENTADCLVHEDSYPDGTKYTVSFRKYDTPQDGAEDLVQHVLGRLSKSAQAGLQNGDSTVMRISYALRRGNYYGGFCPKTTAANPGNPDVTGTANLKTPDKNEVTKACAQEAIEAHAKRTHQIMQDIAGATGKPLAMPLGSYEDADNWWRQTQDGGEGVGEAGVETTPWGAAFGPQKAQAAQKEQFKLEGTPLNSTKLGQEFQAAQKAQVEATRLVLDLMKEVPPLQMLVNPQSFGVKGAKVVNDTNWGRNGPIIEHWGDEQDTISASGKLAAFFSVDRSNAFGPGLTRSARNYSASWQNFMALYAIYRNNGGVYLADYVAPVGESRGNLSLVGSVYIYYDNILYVGSFDSFNITENDSGPFSVDYSFEFKVRAAFLLDRTDDEFTYGAPGLFNNQALNPPGTSTPTTDPAAVAQDAAQAAQENQQNNPATPQVDVVTGA